MNRPAITIVAGCPCIPLPRQSSDSGTDPLDPLSLKMVIASDRATEQLPLIDSRTRYWRYYLLLGPSPSQAYRTLARKLLAIVCHNAQAGARATKGVGSRLFNRLADRRRQPFDSELRRLARNFRVQYGPAAARFWQRAKERSGQAGYRVLFDASRRLRNATRFEGFFDTRMPSLSDGHARNAFHRILRTQSETAADLYGLMIRAPTSSLGSALAGTRKSTLTTDDGRRLVLAWALLVSLFDLKAPPAPGLHSASDNDEEEEEDDDASGIDASLARAALILLRAGVASSDLGLRATIEAMLRDSLESPVYRSPIHVSSRGDDGRRRRLFADLRLSSFRRLLLATRCTL